jgi:hypothetical protein
MHGVALPKHQEMTINSREFPMKFMNSYLLNKYGTSSDLKINSFIRFFSHIFATFFSYIKKMKGDHQCL